MKMNKEKKWLIVEDVAAGLGKVVHVDDFTCGHFAPIRGRMYRNRFHAENALCDLARNSIRFATYRNSAADQYMISAEDDFSGNWRGSMHAPFTYIDDFENKEEAFDSLPWPVDRPSWRQQKINWHLPFFLE